MKGVPPRQSEKGSQQSRPLNPKRGAHIKMRIREQRHTAINSQHISRRCFRSGALAACLWMRPKMTMSCWKKITTNWRMTSVLLSCPGLLTDCIFLTALTRTRTTTTHTSSLLPPRPRPPFLPPSHHYHPPFLPPSLSLPSLYPSYHYNTGHERQHAAVLFYLSRYE